MDGGQWVLQNWSNSEVSDMIPQPADGDKFLVAERFDIHSGTMEYLLIYLIVGTLDCWYTCLLVRWIVGTLACWYI